MDLIQVLKPLRYFWEFKKKFHHSFTPPTFKLSKLFNTVFYEENFHLIFFSFFHFKFSMNGKLFLRIKNKTFVLKDGEFFTYDEEEYDLVDDTVYILEVRELNLEFFI
jgi:hypothetical protein